ncbi:transposable element Tcb1 transposase [Trichonephila clavipes]|nr:transposable element Tcb1 transposase [Trichonephila clavipes]
MARIVRHNDESVRERYIRNGGQEVKLFTSALKAFACNNRIVIAQMKYLDDFLSGRIIGRLECGRTQLEVPEELEIAQSVISRRWQPFQDDGNVSRCYSTGRPRVTTPNDDDYFGSYCQKKQTEHSIRPVSSALFNYRYDSLKADRVQTLRAHWSHMLVGLADLHVQSVTMTGHIYRDVILKEHIRLFRGAMGAEFLFMDDNARPCRRMPSIGGYHPYGLASILTGFESNRACLGYAWPTDCSPSTPYHLSTGTSEGIAC